MKLCVLLNDFEPNFFVDSFFNILMISINIYLFVAFLLPAFSIHLIKSKTEKRSFQQKIFDKQCIDLLGLQANS